MADNSNPKVTVKKKQIPVLVDYCLEESIEFSVKQQTFPDTDWEIDMKLKDFRAAVLLGMFLRENRIEIDGIDPQRYKRPAKKSEEKTDSAAKEEKNKAAKNLPVEPEEITENIETGEPTLM